MMGYKNPGPTQRTNFRNNENLIEELFKGKKVDIYVLAGDEEFHYKGFKINLAAGLEDSVISHFKPKWNLMSRN
jgi:hypothetical protein